MLLDFIFVAIAFYLAIPGVAGYCARSYGRSFWKWFAIGTFLPVITHLILYFYIRRDIKEKKLISMLKKEEIEYMESQIKELGGDQLLPPKQKTRANSAI